MHYDIFNGDADGIIALLQLRLAHPIASTLVTGIKRDIELVHQVSCQPDDSVTVLDISMAKNQTALNQILEQGASVFYADHHLPGAIPEHANLDAHIDTDSNMCTGLIIDRYLQGQFHAWAITAAYGDNLIAKATELAEMAGYSKVQQQQLCELGTLINYNGYGRNVEELHYHPAALFRMLSQYDSPFAVIADKQSPYYHLKQGYDQDIALAQSVSPYWEDEHLRVFLLPAEPASYRISGVFGNLIANQSPEQAHLVLTEINDGQAYTVSLRAPLSNKQGAGGLCSEFATGGGREGAGGINSLPKHALDELITKVASYYRH